MLTTTPLSIINILLHIMTVSAKEQLIVNSVNVSNVVIFIILYWRKQVNIVYNKIIMESFRISPRNWSSLARSDLSCISSVTKF